MTLVKSVKGRLPMNSGDYDSSKVYGKKYRCNLYGCEWESLIEGNNSAPATLVNGVVTPNTAKWRLVSGVPGNYGLDQVVEALDQAKADKSTTLAGYGITNAYTKEEVNGLITTPDQQFVSVYAEAGTTDVEALIHAQDPTNEKKADTIYRVGNWDGSQFDDTVYSEYAWNGTDYVHLSTKTQIGEVFDISAYHATGGTLQTYTDLTDALTGTNGGVPQSLQKGGMSIKFVQTSDNKYVQYFLTKDEWSVSEADWEKMNLEEDVSLLGREAGAADSIFKSVPTIHNPVSQFIDLSIKNKVSGKVYWLQILWNSAIYQQFTVFRADENNPGGYDTFYQFKNSSVIDSGIKIYTATFNSGELVTCVIDWGQLSISNNTYSYKLPDYVYRDDVFNGGLIYNKLQKPIQTDDTLMLAGVSADAKAVGELFSSLMEEDKPFDIDNRGIWAETTGEHIGGEVFISGGYKITDFISVANIYKVVCVLQSETASTWAGIACYDSDKSYLGCLRGFYYNQPPRTIFPADFPVNTAYIRFCTYYNSTFEENLFITICSKERIKQQIEDYVDTQIGPQNKFWAVCGDSITNANHGNIHDIPEDDPYLPIDGYAALNTYKRKNYAYYIAKKNRIKWANYGYGGTTMTHTAPKAYSGQVFYPFVDERITELKSGVDWDYISIFFGWNDCAYNPVYQRDLWLTETYGEDLGYPEQSAQISAPGFANQTQKDACDAATGSVGGVEYTDNVKFFFAKFIGTINDATKNTWCGAFNYAIPYLLNKYRKAKLLLIVPFRSPSWQSKMIREATIAIAEKWGVPYFDFEELPYWFKKTQINTQAFANPDNVNGYWYTESGAAFSPNMDGYNTAKYSYDGIHPSNVGYQTMAGPIEAKLIDG